MAKSARTGAAKVKAEPASVDDGYTYYWHDGSGFRGRTPPSGRFAPAEEVFMGGAWKRYTGDMLEPSMFGSRVTKAVAEAD